MRQTAQRSRWLRIRGFLSASLTRGGFALSEFVAVLVIMFLILVIAVPNFARVQGRSKEAEVKLALHDVQLAIERYATDNREGAYPPFLFGGDYTDSFTVDRAYVKANDLDTRRSWPSLKPANLGEPGAVDVLITGGYITSYPRNPFLRRRAGEPMRLACYSSVGEPAKVERLVGGRTNDVMFDVAGPPPVGAVPGRYHGDEFIVPPYLPTNASDWNGEAYSSRLVTEEDRRKGDVGDPILPGNFYYLARLAPGADGSTGWASPNHGKPEGYRVAAFGSLHDLGFDVYDACGDYDFQGRILPWRDRLRWKGGPLPGMKAPGSSAQPNVYHEVSKGGPDGFRDGVIIVLSSGEERAVQAPHATAPEASPAASPPGA